MANAVELALRDYTVIVSLLKQNMPFFIECKTDCFCCWFCIQYLNRVRIANTSTFRSKIHRIRGEF
ncbi:hypothetical protein QUA79_27740 [Microcoleus sp. F8-D1]